SISEVGLTPSRLLWRLQRKYSKRARALFCMFSRGSSFSFRTPNAEESRDNCLLPSLQVMILDFSSNTCLILRHCGLQQRKRWVQPVGMNRTRAAKGTEAPVRKIIGLPATLINPSPG